MRKLVVVLAALALVGGIAFASEAQEASAKPTTTTSPTTTTVPQGIVGYQVASSSVDIPADYTAPIAVFVACPPGKRILGGGGTAPDQSAAGAWAVTSSWPTGDGWKFVIHREGEPDPLAGSATAWAICATVAA
jgi:hypothetical protein